MTGKFNRYFPWLIFLFSALTITVVLYSGARLHLFGMPPPGTDQLTMLQAAAGMYNGQLPNREYLYSPSYTFFLFLLVVLTRGELFDMLLLQGILCALTPVFLYKLARAARMSFRAAQTAALLLCLYAPFSLLAVTPLREAPLALCFVLYVYLLLRGFGSRSGWKIAAAGVFGGLCIMGRETFIPVMVVPFALLFLADIRRHVVRRHICIYAAAIFLTLAPVLVCNYIRFDTISIIPGHFNNILGSFHGDKALNDRSFAVMNILRNIPHQMYLFLSSYEYDNSVSVYAHKEMVFTLRLLFFPYNLFPGLALVALWAFRRNRGMMLITLMALGYAGTMLYFDLYYRYRFPVVPVLLALSGPGLWYVATRKGLKQLALPVLVVAAVFALTWDSPSKMRRPNERYAVVNALVVNRNFDAAEAYVRQLQQEKIPVRPAVIVLIRALHGDGQTARAEKLYREFLPLE